MKSDSSLTVRGHGRASPGPGTGLREEASRGARATRQLVAVLQEGDRAGGRQRSVGGSTHQLRWPPKPALLPQGLGPHVFNVSPETRRSYTRTQCGSPACGLCGATQSVCTAGSPVSSRILVGRGLVRSPKHLFSADAMQLHKDTVRRGPWSQLHGLDSGQCPQPAPGCSSDAELSLRDGGRAGSPGRVGPPRGCDPARVDPCALPGGGPRRPENGPRGPAAESRPRSGAFDSAGCGLGCSDEHIYIPLCAITAKSCVWFSKMRKVSTI